MSAGTAVITGETLVGDAIESALAAAGWTVVRVTLDAPADRAAVAAALAAATAGAAAGGAAADVAATGGAAGGGAGASSGPDAPSGADAAVDLLVTTAPASSAEPVAFDAIDHAAWSAAVDAHLRGPANAVRALLPGMLERGSGAIVVVTSAAALDGGDGESHDAAAQGAAIGMVKALAREFGPRGIDANVVAAGAVDPEEVAATVLYLATEPHYMAGAVLSATAGAVA